MNGWRGSYEYDMVVIGGGAAGLTAAGMAAVLGARTALIEVKKLGGDCTWHGCIPSKSLLHAAKVAHQMRTAGRYGLTATAPAHDFAKVMARVRAIREHIYQDADAPPNFERLGAEVIEGRARFVEPHAVEVASNSTLRTLRSRYFVVATGSSPVLPDVPGIGAAHVVTNETVFELDRLPERTLVVGAGPVGIELAQAFQRLGSQVTVVNRAPGILVRDDPELTTLLTGRLRAEGIRFVLGTELDRVEQGAAYTKSGERLEADTILAAAGRRPNIGSLNLPAAQVETNPRGVAVDRRCRSSARHIYACGDVAGRHLFTHFAEHMAKVAVTNAILRIPTRLDERNMAWCTYSDPELAHAGSSEAELRRAGVTYSVYRFPYSQLDRAITESETTGLVKVLANHRGRVLGVSILGVNAGEMIAEYVLAMRNGVRLDQVSATIHPYPTYALGNRRAADLFLTAKLTPRLARWIQRIFGLRGDLRGATFLRTGGLAPRAPDIPPRRN